MALDPALPQHDTITQLAQTNINRTEHINRKLAPQGQQLTFNRQTAILECLLDELMGTDSGRRSRFELAWQQDIAASLDEAEAELRKGEIMRGVGGSN